MSTVKSKVTAETLAYELFEQRKLINFHRSKKKSASNLYLISGIIGCVISLGESTLDMLDREQRIGLAVMQNNPIPDRENKPPVLFVASICLVIAGAAKRIEGSTYPAT